MVIKSICVTFKNINILEYLKLFTIRKNMLGSKHINIINSCGAKNLTLLLTLSKDLLHILSINVIADCKAAIPAANKLLEIGFLIKSNNVKLKSRSIREIMPLTIIGNNVQIKAISKHLYNLML
jgi:hypothetical protein